MILPWPRVSMPEPKPLAEGEHRVEVGDVGAHTARPPPELTNLGRDVVAARIATPQDNVRAGGGERERARSADASPRAGDECGAAVSPNRSFEPAHRSVSTSTGSMSL